MHGVDRTSRLAGGHRLVEVEADAPEAVVDTPLREYGRLPPEGRKPPEGELGDGEGYLGRAPRCWAARAGRLVCHGGLSSVDHAAPINIVPLLAVIWCRHMDMRGDVVPRDREVHHPLVLERVAGMVTHHRRSCSLAR